MSTWYHNDLKVLGPTADRSRFKEKAVGAYYHLDETVHGKPQALCFDNFIPTPASVLEKGNIESGKDWRIENWGALYMPLNTELKSEQQEFLLYLFSTKDGPPIRFFERIGPHWPMLTFLLKYAHEYDEVVGICMVQGTSIDQCELVLDPREDYGFLTDEQFLALAAELKPRTPLVEDDFEYKGQFRSNHPGFARAIFGVRHATAKL